MALYKLQFLSLPKYLIKFKLKQPISSSRNSNSLYEYSAKKVYIKTETKQRKLQETNRKNLNYTNVCPYCLVKRGLPLKIDQIIRKSARCFLFPKSCSRFQIRFLADRQLTSSENNETLENLYLLAKFNERMTIMREKTVITLFYSLEILKKTEHQKNCNTQETVFRKNTLFTPNNLNTIQVRSYSTKPPDDKPDKPCERIDSANKLTKLCERLSKPNPSNNKEANVITIETEEDKLRNRLETGTIVLRGDPDYSLINGVPIEITCWRRARIYQPRKNPMQSGTRHIGHWELAYDSKGRWENPLMGWASSGDSVANVILKFSTKEEAVNYCVNNNMEYYVQESKIQKKFKAKSYGINFHHKNRTRFSTK